MTKKSQTRLLIDNCIFRNSVVVVPAQIEKTIQWGDIKITAPITGLRQKPELPFDQKWKQTQIECLPTIARLAKEKKLVLYSYDELDFESWKESQGVKGGKGDLLYGVKIHAARSPIDRSKFVPLTLDQVCSREDVIKYCQFLINLDPCELSEDICPRLRSRFDDFELRNIDSLDQFRGICKTLAPKQYPDALHLWTGEVNGLDFFLTTDRKFINAITQSSKLNLNCKTISPEGLLDHLEITERDPMPFDHDGFRYLHEASIE